MVAMVLGTTLRLQTRWLVLGTLAGLMSLAGCAAETDQVLELQRDKLELQRKLRQTEGAIVQQQKILRQKDEQISTLSNLDQEQLKVLFTVEKIVLGRYSGGTNPDKKGGDDGVRVYLIPQDQSGRTVTAVGTVEISVFDLARKEKSLLMSYSFTAAKAKEHWQSSSLANHYSFTCLWKDRQPLGDEITIHVKFVDYLSRRSFRATKQCRINNSQTR
jgi:hypothetical protein